MISRFGPPKQREAVHAKNFQTQLTTLVTIRDSPPSFQVRFPVSDRRTEVKHAVPLTPAGLEERSAYPTMQQDRSLQGPMSKSEVVVAEGARKVPNAIADRAGEAVAAPGPYLSENTALSVLRGS